MATLFAAERGAELLHPFEDVAVADPRPLQPDPRVGQHPLQAHVAHHRGHHHAARQRAARRQVAGADRHDDIAVHDPAAFVHGDHPVGVAIVGEPDLRAGGDDGLLQLGRVRGTAADVDARAVGLGVQRDDFGAPGHPQSRRDPVGRPKGAVHDDAQAGLRAQAQAEEVVQVEVLRLRQVANAAHLRAGRVRAVRPEGGLDAVLHIIRKLEAVRAEELHAVIFDGVVRRGQDDAAGPSQAARQESQRGRGEDADAFDVAAAGADDNTPVDLTHGAVVTNDAPTGAASSRTS